mgnify:CR=1 FL=1
MSNRFDGITYAYLAKWIADQEIEQINDGILQEVQMQLAVFRMSGIHCDKCDLEVTIYREQLRRLERKNRFLETSLRGCKACLELNKKRSI